MNWFVTYSLCVAVYTVVSAATFTCPSLFNWHPDETDCSKFYRCIWGKAQSFTCASGTFWSQKLLTCDFQHHVKCQTGSSPDSSLHSHGNSENHSNTQSQEKSQNQGNSRNSDNSLDLKNDFQLQHKNPQKGVTEKGSYKHPVHPDSENNKYVNEDDDKFTHPENEDNKHMNENNGKGTHPENEDNKHMNENNGKVTHPENEDNKHMNENHGKGTHPDYWHDHTHDDDNTEPRNDDVVLDFNTDLTYNHFPLDKKTQTRRHRFHDATEDGHWDYFYQEGQDNEEFTDHEGQDQEMDNSYSKLHSLQQFLEEFLSSQSNALQHQPSPRYTVQQKQHHRQQQQQQQQQHRDVLAPAAAAQDNPPASAMETARKQLFNDILVSKLLQHSQFSGYMYQPNTLINTDGTYDVLDVQLHTPDSSHKGQFEPYRSGEPQPYSAGQFQPYRSGQVTSTDPWPMTDLFRAGYGYKRIFHAK